MSRPLAVIRSEIAEAGARLNEALGRLDTAWTALRDNEPGFSSGKTPSGDDPGTQPERLHATYRNDPAYNDLARLDRAARQALGAATDAYDVTTRWGPAHTPKHNDTDGPGDEWCRSCWRDNHYCEPIDEGRYARYCRWCGDFYANYQREPPNELLRARHEGRRITSTMVDRALKSKAS